MSERNQTSLAGWLNELDLLAKHPNRMDGWVRNAIKVIHEGLHHHCSEALNRRAPSTEQQQQEPVGMVRLVTYEGVAKNSVEWEAVLSEEVKFNRDRFKDGEPLYTHQQPQAQGEPVATLHSDGYWVWKGSAPPESNYAGWKMEVYAQPRAAVPDVLREKIVQLIDEIEDTEEHGQGAFEDTCSICTLMQEIQNILAAAPAQPGDAQVGEG